MPNLSLKPYGPYDHIGLLTSAAVNKARNEGNSHMGDIVKRLRAAKPWVGKIGQDANVPVTLWKMLRKHGVGLYAAQMICNDVMLHGVTLPSDAPAQAAPTPTGSDAAAAGRKAAELVQSAYDEMCVKFSGVHSDDEMDGVLLRLHAALKVLTAPRPSPEPLSRPAQTRG